MKRIFLDTNILLDVFLERSPFFHPAQIVWSLAETKKIRAALSAVSIINIFYVIKKLSSASKAYEAITALPQIFKVVDTTSSLLSKALKAGFSDFEDSVQYFSALKFGAKAIISRDPAGFASSKIPVIDAVEYLALLEEK